MSENKNAALWFVDRHVGEGRGENLAFREADGARRMQTYAQLAQRSDLIAGAFVAAGLRREERVAGVWPFPPARRTRGNTGCYCSVFWLLMGY